MSTAKIIMLPVIALTSSLMALPAADAAENDDSHSHLFANVHRDTATSRHCLPGFKAPRSRPVSQTAMHALRLEPITPASSVHNRCLKECAEKSCQGGLCCSEERTAGRRVQPRRLRTSSGHPSSGPSPTTIGCSWESVVPRAIASSVSANHGSSASLPTSRYASCAAWIAAAASSKRPNDLRA
jgi:hypothetical protein